MYRLFPTALAFALLLVSVAPAQTPTPSPTPAADEQVVKISTALIQVDVTVTGKDGEPVRDLRRDEVQIYENGKLQPISNFSFVDGTGAAASAADRRTAPPDIRLPTRPVRPDEVRRTIALVVDDLTLSFASTAWVRDALKRFVNEQMRDGDLVAIIRTGAGVGALQQFTTDKRQLMAAISRVRFNLGGTAKVGAFNVIQQGEGGDAVAAERELNEFRETIFANGTLGAMNFVVRGMSELPGRKSIMLLSDGFALYTRDDRGVPTGSRVLYSLRRLTDLANRASVVIYTLDAKGMQAGGLEASDSTIDMSPEQIEGGLNDRRNAIFNTQEGLTYLARQTGGFAVLNQNNISRGIRRVLDDQSYYLVGYQPDDDTFDPKMRRFNKLEVKVTRPGTRVRYRSGFFGVSDEQIVKPKMNATQAILNALTSPFAVNDVSVRMNAVVASDAKQGAFVRSFINVDARDLTFKKGDDGKYTTSFDLVALNFGDNGAILDERSKNFSMTVDEGEYRRLLQRGLVSSFTLPIKKPGGYQVRIAFRDVASEKVGSANQFVEVPNLKKNRLMISGAVLEGVPMEKVRAAAAGPTEGVGEPSDPIYDTSVRQFRKGTLLRFAYDIYNAKLDAGGKAGLDYHATLFRDGAVVADGKTLRLTELTYEPPNRISTISSIIIGSLPAGDYVLKFDVTDRLSGKKKKGTATQFVQFEVVE